MIVSNNFAVPYYLNVRKEKGMTAYYWATALLHKPSL